MTGWAVPVATLGPVGRWPWGPGTLASALVALVWLVGWPVWAWAGVVAVLTVVGVVAGDRAEAFLGHDDGRIVIDEVAGMGIALLAAPRTWIGASAAFLLFRLLDIAKPPPLGRLQDVRGGAGVMLDDVAAGVLAAGLIALGRSFT